MTTNKSDKLYSEGIKILNERGTEKDKKGRTIPTHPYFATHYRVNSGPWKGFRLSKKETS